MARLSVQYQRLTVLVVVFLCTGLAHADWALNNKDSSISFVSVKNATVTEVNNFKNISGIITDDGKTHIQIDLDSVNTLIPIRDERIRKMLLETGLYPKATISTSIKSASLKALKLGESLSMPVSFELDLHGIKKQMKSDVLVVALSDQRVLVTTTSPLALNLANHNLINGVNKLREIAKLSTISTSVAITATLIFSK